MTHFQYLTWTSLGAPPLATPLLEFRRKVNKASSHNQAPLLVHCSGGVGRTGTYMLIDMALTRIQSGIVYIMYNYIHCITKNHSQKKFHEFYETIVLLDLCLVRVCSTHAFVKLYDLRKYFVTKDFS